MDALERGVTAGALGDGTPEADELSEILSGRCLGEPPVEMKAILTLFGDAAGGDDETCRSQVMLEVAALGGNIPLIKVHENCARCDNIVGTSLATMRHGTWYDVDTVEGGRCVDGEAFDTLGKPRSNRQEWRHRPFFRRSHLTEKAHGGEAFQVAEEQVEVALDGSSIGSEAADRLVVHPSAPSRICAASNARMSSAR